MKIGSLLLKSPPPKMALAINSFWKNGTHKIFNGCDTFSSSSSWGYQPAMDLDGIPYTSANSELYDLAAPNNGSVYEYTWYIKPDEFHTDYSFNLYAIDIKGTRGYNLYSVNILKPVYGENSTIINLNGSQIYIAAGNINSNYNEGHYIRIEVPFSYFYKNYNYAVTGDKTVSIYRPTILDLFYAYLA